MHRFISLVVVAFALIIKYSTGQTYLSDLNVNPDEENIFESLSSEYTGIYDSLVERSSYWSDYVIQPSKVNVADKKSTWKKNGGVTSWLTSDNFTQLEIQQLYNYSDAPNIVFVLVDDWVS